MVSDRRAGNIREHNVAHGLSLKQAVEYLECGFDILPGLGRLNETL